MGMSIGKEVVAMQRMTVAELRGKYAEVFGEETRRHYNEVRPHSSLGYRPPAPAAIRPLPPGSGALRQPAMAATALT